MTSGPLPPEYKACDVLYTDLPWRPGFEEFNRRAGVEGREYQEFLAAVSRIVNDFPGPVVLVTGKHARRDLPAPDHVMKSRLNGAPCIALSYRLDPAKFCINPEFCFCDVEMFLTWLAERFECVGDFCCGYGRVGRIFQEYGRRWVMSDFNPTCIGYIGENL